ncbi:MAG: chemotaxis response regulator protein-glutamate methylesterase [Hahellaceae bacterium]|nr:chemotaxis response regulator protein-glutamate methylesterase [Hahellaceae bacterium]
MAVSVLVVDDSGFFRRRVSEILGATSDIKVIGTASNGREAIDLVQKLRPDVITMDYEMPVMDGVTAVRNIMNICPTPVLMFSSLTYEGARVTLDALDAGAVDYLPKNFEDISRDSSQMQDVLRQRILALARSKSTARKVEPAPAFQKPSIPAEVTSRTERSTLVRPANQTLPKKAEPSRVNKVSELAVAKSPSATQSSRARTERLSDVSLVAIGTSTGGPVALQKVLTQLPASFPKPIVLIQHMPASFTPAFAERLNSLCNIRVKQADDGDLLQPGLALLAPGGRQMLIERGGNWGKVRILDGDERLHYKPCVDVTFGSAARAYPGKTLGIVLTGMGADGKEGAKLMKKNGGVIWAQDEKSCVIYGMPMAIAKAGIADEILPLSEVALRLINGVG